MPAACSPPRGRRAPPRRQQRGYTYIGLLVLLSVVALASALTLEVAEIAGRRSAEAELRAIGREMERAFMSYYEQAPVGTPRYPKQLQDLVRDPRTPGMKRHLRRIYRDPLTGSTEWGLVPAPGGGIMGIYSLAPGTPLREVVPDGPLMAASAPAPAASAGGYADWKFGYVPQAAPRRASAPPVTGMPAPNPPTVPPPAHR